MSSIGNRILTIPEGVTVTEDNGIVTVKGPKGELTQKVDPSIEVVIEGGVITLTYAGGKTLADATKQEHAYHGLYRALINNMVIGVSAGFTKELELVGVGYRVNDKPNNAIELLLGYSHGIYMQFPAEVKVTTKSERNKNPLITLESCNKELLGLICAKIRSYRKPEPYKGKGIKFVGEVIRRKSGKSAGAK